jgi:hypothetical protein
MGNAAYGGAPEFQQFGIHTGGWDHGQNSKIMYWDRQWNSPDPPDQSVIDQLQSGSQRVGMSGGERFLTMQ